MRNVDTQLTSLPKSFADNPQAHLLRLCSAFIQEVDSYTNGKPNHNPDDRTFLQEGQSHYQSLKALIEGTRPRFVICPTAVVENGEPPVMEPPVIEGSSLWNLTNCQSSHWKTSLKSLKNFQLANSTESPRSLCTSTSLACSFENGKAFV